MSFTNSSTFVGHPVYLTDTQVKFEGDNLKEPHIGRAVRFSFFMTCIGTLMFFANWQLSDEYGGTLPGYQWLLLPGNLSLVYFWHPIFTEEVNFWPKLFMLLVGQFIISLLLSWSVLWRTNQLKKLH